MLEPSDPLLNLNGLRAEGIHLSSRQIRRLELAGKFPERLRLTERTVAWRRSEVLRWISAKAAARSNTIVA